MLSSRIHVEITFALLLFTWTLFILPSHFCQGSRVLIRALDVPSAAATGVDLSLSCHYDLVGAALYALRWYKEDREFFRYMPKEKPSGRTFNVPGIQVDVKESNASSVTLRRVNASTSGVFRCEVSAEAPSFDTDMREAHLHVVDPPKGKPHIVHISKGTFGLNETVVANCTGPTGKPAPKLVWLVAGIQVDERFVWQSASSQERDSVVTRLAVPVSWILEHQSTNHLNASLWNNNVTVELRCSSSVFNIFRDHDSIYLTIRREVTNPLAETSASGRKTAPGLTGSAKNFGGSHGALTNKASTPEPCLMGLLLITSLFSVGTAVTQLAGLS